MAAIGCLCGPRFASHPVEDALSEAVLFLLMVGWSNLPFYRRMPSALVNNREFGDFHDFLGPEMAKIDFLNPIRPKPNF